MGVPWISKKIFASLRDPIIPFPSELFSHKHEEDHKDRPTHGTVIIYGYLTVILIQTMHLMRSPTG